MKKREKAIRIQVLGLVISYEISKGHLKWKISDVSRRLKISRSLIYYHFGKTKADILDACYRMIAQEFYGLNHDFTKILDFDNRILETSLVRTRKIYLETPAIVTFFHRWRLEDSPARERIIDMEKTFQDKLQKALPWLKRDEILAVHSIIHGVGTSPFATPGSVEIVVELLKPLLKATATPRAQ